MKTLAPMNAAEWRQKVRQTRAHGACYIPAASRDGLTENGIRYSWQYYGRSAQGGGHKHKAYAHDAETGATIRSKDL
jgi:hypothetical protein